MAEEQKSAKKEKAASKAPLWKRILLNPIVLTLAAIVVLSLIGMSMLQSWLDGYTKHGVEVEVPDLKGLSEMEAGEILQLKHVTYEVIDSTYIRGQKPGAVVDQVPKAGSKVKEGRKIYLTIQAHSARKVQLPEVREGSARQAEATLSSLGLKVGELEYVPSEQAGNVIEVKYREKTVLPGIQLVEGSELTLVVGRGLSNEESTVASLRGLTLEQAKNRAHESGLNVGVISYDSDLTTDELKAQAIVYKQSPITGMIVPTGTRVNMYFTRDKSKLDEVEEIFKDSVATDSIVGTSDGIWGND